MLSSRCKVLVPSLALRKLDMMVSACDPSIWEIEQREKVHSGVRKQVGPDWILVVVFTCPPHPGGDPSLSALFCLLLPLVLYEFPHNSDWAIDHQRSAEAASCKFGGSGLKAQTEQAVPAWA